MKLIHKNLNNRLEMSKKKFLYFTGKEMMMVSIKKMKHRDGRKSGITSLKRSKEEGERKCNNIKS